MPVTPLRWRKLSVPKRGHRSDEYEDAAVGDGGRGRFAVADGATESAFAGDWARLLAESFVREPAFERGWGEWLPTCGARLEAGGRELPWYLEESSPRRVRHAARFGTHGRRRWGARYVSDCFCSRSRRRDGVRLSLEESAAFNTSPELLGSRPVRPAIIGPASRHPGDRFFASMPCAMGIATRRGRRTPWPELLAILQR